MIVTLVRHGQASFAADDYDQLSELGREQSIRLGHFLKTQEEDLGTVITGGLLRHKQTAEALFEGYGSEFNTLVDEHWNEFDHVDVIRQFVVRHPQYQDDVLSKDARRVLPVLAEALRFWQTGKAADSYIECWETFHQRLKKGWQQLVGVAEDTTKVTVITSGGPIALSSLLALQADHKHFVDFNTKLVNSSYSRFNLTAQKHELLSFNEQAHVSGKFSKLRSYR
ncbi:MULTISPECIES: histidine phosphatase family protein [Gammaproteobacteria]|uniref:histidine phosphatase family protein n=1 Tax=Gammaproteobacteria TaxID=1236 RepID=UPI000DD0DAD9|nr:MULTISPECIES: histidine phosphatase family protein [Gammaproteobacteria]RTE87354.1 histidine phosphatase family protein [Aliidiomarina sp. B3213]TCZ92860.1 histidine phosphatase family protein [Lysobacter sp. N42]